MKKALIIQGGWEGHEPKKNGKRFSELLEKEHFEVTISNTLDCLSSFRSLLMYDLLVLFWTKGEIKKEYTQNVSRAVAAGVGLAGCHGGLCDSFRQDTRWQFMVGGQWVSHPGGDGVEYTVNIHPGSSPLVEGLSDFKVVSEQYYMHVDPAVEVLASTRFPVVSDYHCTNKPVDMPVAWTKFWGCGRVFYLSIGHHDDVFDKTPTAQILMLRGMLWASEGKRIDGPSQIGPDRITDTVETVCPGGPGI